MDIFGSFVILVLTFLCIAHPLLATPEENTYQHIVKVDVTDIFLFNLIRETNGNLSEQNVHSVFRRILTKHHVDLDKFNPNSSLKALTSKLGRLWKSWRSATGTNGRQRLWRKFGNSTYTLKVQHETGSPNKRKLEQELKTEKAKRRKLEDDLAAVKSELNESIEEKKEVCRKLKRLSNPLKRQRGERGRQKGKDTYSQSQNAATS